MSKQPVQFFCDGCGGLTACWCNLETPESKTGQRKRINTALEELRVAILSGDTGTALDAWLVLNQLVRIHV